MECKNLARKTLVGLCFVFDNDSPWQIRFFYLTRLYSNRRFISVHVAPFTSLNDIITKNHSVGHSVSCHLCLSSLFKNLINSFSEIIAPRSKIYSSNKLLWLVPAEYRPETFGILGKSTEIFFFYFIKGEARCGLRMLHYYYFFTDSIINCSYFEALHWTCVTRKKH